MSKKTPPIEPVHDALLLDGDPDNLNSYYARWASNYDSDLVDYYDGPEFMISLLVENLPNCFGQSFDIESMQVMDAGCGTGMLGTHLHNSGFKHIHGTDLSEDMVVEARKLSVYESLYGGVDLSVPPQASWLGAFDIVVCCGVFTLGHVEASAMWELLKMVKPGGVLMVSTRTSYYDNCGFQAVNDAIDDSANAELKKVVFDAPYTKDGDAHYWIYKVGKAST